MKTTLTAIAALLIASASLAQNGQPGQHFIDNWDLDANGEVSLQEAQDRRGEIFFMFDQDDNGSLDAAEYQLFDETRAADMANNGGGGGHGGMQNVSRGMAREFNDTDGDGLVTREEFTSHSAAWFDMMDRNGDGVVTTDDFGPNRG